MLFSVSICKGLCAVMYVWNGRPPVFPSELHVPPAVNSVLEGWRAELLSVAAWCLNNRFLPELGNVLLLLVLLFELRLLCVVLSDSQTSGMKNAAEGKSAMESFVGWPEQAIVSRKSRVPIPTPPSMDPYTMAYRRSVYCIYVAQLFHWGIYRLQQKNRKKGKGGSRLFLIDGSFPVALSLFSIIFLFVRCCFSLLLRMYYSFMSTHKRASQTWTQTKLKLLLYVYYTWIFCRALHGANAIVWF